MRRHLLKNEIIDESERKLGILVWKTIYSLYNIEEIGEDLYWQETVIPQMKKQFGNFLQLPGNNDIINNIFHPSLLFKSYIDLPRLAKRLCKLMNIKIHIENWENFNEFKFLPKITELETNIRIDIRFLHFHIQYWWEKILFEFEFIKENENYKCFSLFNQNDQIKFKEKLFSLSKNSNNHHNEYFYILSLIQHVIRICKCFVYENSCHGSDFQQNLLFFLASIVDENSDLISIDRLFIPFSLSFNNFQNFMKSEIDIMAEKIINNDKIQISNALCKIYNLPSKTIYQNIQCNSLCTLILNYVVDILFKIDLNNEKHRKEKKNEILIIRSLLIFCYIKLKQSLFDDIEQLFLCYELLFKVFCLPNDSLEQFYFSISFLLDLKFKRYNDDQSSEVLIRTYIQLFWFLQKFLFSNNIDDCKKRIYSSYFLARDISKSIHDLPSQVYFLLHRCETVLTQNDLEKYEKLSKDQFIDDLELVYLPFLKSNVSPKFENYISNAKEFLRNENK